MAEILANIGWLQLVLVGVVVIFAAILRAFTGFGFGLAAVPVFAFLMTPAEAVVLSTSLTLAVSVLTRKTYLGKYPLRPMLPLLVMAVVGTFIGVALLAVISAEQFRLWIGLSVVLACLVLGYYRPGQRALGPWVGGFTGFCGGVLNGAFAIPGPPVIIYVMATETDAGRSRALLLTFFLFMSAVALATYVLVGLVTPAAPLYFLLAFPAMYVGDKIGYRLFGRYGNAAYRHMALLLLFVLGVAITLEALW